MAEVNTLPADEFVAAFGPVWEHADWVARKVWEQRPFDTAADMHAAMLECVQTQSTSEIDTFLARHPDIAGPEAQQGRMTTASTVEQGALALTSRDAVWDARNADYRARYGFPFILCLRRHSRASADAIFEMRRSRPIEVERAAALAEVAHITRLRLADRIRDHGLSVNQAHIAVTVTDLSQGQRPAKGLKVKLTPPSPELALREAECDSEGRVLFGETSGPLRIGLYELDFLTAAYFSAPYPALPLLALPMAVTDPEVAISLLLDITPHGFAVSTLN